MTLAIDRFDHIVLNVKDVETSAAWYEQVLGMKREDFESRSGKRVSVKFGQQKINLRPVGEDTVAWFTGVHPTSGSDDLCFITHMPPKEVVAHFLAHKVAVEVGPVQRTGALGAITSVYCRDPDGNLIEVASYPAA
ncbi:MULTISPECIES: VOC family protein [Cupriavidus]|jgi:catechol 2,3-dioxygenase-like lactoylglutathione lyase family enzyme|uniref:VOC family protein n=1 Tax=Cupriavidus metallidurans TaxID=119219 RepID=A0A482ISF9_9BURK|nr:MULTISPECIES: VOC family protein [Cupriavidus]KWR75998.1 virulence protein [Cupriavidus sp. SHE]QBP12025.1 VOC family protein [Cupriavidus metallidurans]QWC91989.1 VOC family protein [Cupriavidus metallidurans]UBM07428.1 VOC family protein [Cupriavidus metallidurans]